MQNMSQENLKNSESIIHTIGCQNCLKYFRCVEYDNWFSINQDIKALFSDAGHILGAASITLKINENGKETMLGFSGDIGRYNRPILERSCSNAGIRLFHL